MTEYSGWQYLCIDVANTFGLDKKLFGERIQWTLDHLESLESLVDMADSKPAYLKSVQALRKAQKGIPTGHLVELDACCSGLQMLSVLTGCTSGANATGLVDPAVRADAYSSVTALMNEHLKDQGISVDIPRAQAKEAVN